MFIYEFKAHLEDLKNNLDKTLQLVYNLINEKDKEKVIEKLSYLEELIGSISSNIDSLIDFFRYMEEKGTKFGEYNLHLLFYNYYFILKERSFVFTKEVELFSYLEKLKKRVNSIKEYLYFVLENPKSSSLFKIYKILSSEYSHLEFVLAKTNNLISNLSLLSVENLHFSDLALKEIKKRKNFLEIKSILIHIEALVKEGIRSNRIRKFNKGLAKELGLYDFLDSHTKERIIIKPIFEGNNWKEVIIFDIFFDHLGKEKEEYMGYWEGFIRKVKNLECLSLDKELLAFLISKDSNLLRLLFKIIKESHYKCY